MQELKQSKTDREINADSQQAINQHIFSEDHVQKVDDRAHPSAQLLYFVAVCSTHESRRKLCPQASRGCTFSQTPP
jgi:hypothetical protein